MQLKHLDVSHVLMVVDPTAAHWEKAVSLAESLVETGTRTTFACICTPPPAESDRIAKLPESEIRVGANPEELEWMLFLEMLAVPCLVQAFEPEHLLLPWRSPTVLHVPDSALIHPSRALFDASSIANLIVVEDETRFDKLQALVGAGPFVAVLKSGENCGWSHFFAYQEIVQSARLDLEDPVGRIELI